MGNVVVYLCPEYHGIKIHNSSGVVQVQGSRDTACIAVHRLRQEVPRFRMKSEKKMLRTWRRMSVVHWLKDFEGRVMTAFRTSRPRLHVVTALQSYIKAPGVVN